MRIEPMAIFLPRLPGKSGRRPGRHRFLRRHFARFFLGRKNLVQNQSLDPPKQGSQTQLSAQLSARLSAQLSARLSARVFPGALRPFRKAVRRRHRAALRQQRVFDPARFARKRFPRLRGARRRVLIRADLRRKFDPRVRAGWRPLLPCHVLFQACNPSRQTPNIATQSASHKVKKVRVRKIVGMK
jgi:hypothetical protein